MPFIYTRTIRFQDTDAAGVVYFANVLAMCHEAYEESLAASGINLQSFFQNPTVAIPIVHASVDFFRPMFCGDQQTIHLTPEPLTDYEFEIGYQVFKIPGSLSQTAKTSENDVSSGLAATERASLQLVGKAITRHVCIDSANRTRKEMPAEMIQWLQQWSRPSDRESD
jgi:1,4-dihydroxy-2-naphthoyl-CoA hydrolase